MILNDSMVLKCAIFPCSKTDRKKKIPFFYVYSQLTRGKKQKVLGYCRKCYYLNAGFLFLKTGEVVKISKKVKKLVKKNSDWFNPTPINKNKVKVVK